MEVVSFEIAVAFEIEFPFKFSTGTTDYGIGRFKDTGKYFKRKMRIRAGLEI